MLTQFVVVLEALQENAEVRESDRAALFVIRVAEVSTVVSVGVVLRWVCTFRAVVEVVADAVTVEIGERLGGQEKCKTPEVGRRILPVSAMCSATCVYFEYANNSTVANK
jgi:hypothetical protein